MQNDATPRLVHCSSRTQNVQTPPVPHARLSFCLQQAHFRCTSEAVEDWERGVLGRVVLERLVFARNAQSVSLLVAFCRVRHVLLQAVQNGLQKPLLASLLLLAAALIAFHEIFFGSCPFGVVGHLQHQVSRARSRLVALHCCERA